MKTIVNKTRKPMRIGLPGGKTLHLGPARTGQISDEASQAPGIRRLVEAGEIEIVGEESHPQSGAGTQGVVPEAPKGHHPKTIVLPKGNR
ncbi:MAG: hypothetical protein DMF49_06880 [Acidobacteria bacterium]|nr:MAG: hypothetical protein DMF49_06880 [Acidobacteriota bacterium]